ncbi:SDR family oxidoreductase [Candidatus Igneacidithiobacillus taiwanensis]|uniref:SDR family NAD(P)-dependent oxidoreductase n=1 Tax=Candidatus Igneacidithiobacillus taiwanensis TaxID=1945924 RepID=UPI0028A098BB|nr:SDR family oxidoreductase [Candidatus Igneacidithiobacillus taiwanensis]
MSKLIVMTGASGALAQALLRQVRERGWRVVAVSRQAPPENWPETDIWLQEDVSHQAGADAVFAALRQRELVPDYLAHLAGSFLLAGLAQTSEETYRQVLAANLDSAFFSLRAFVAARKRAGEGGAAVFVSSVVADIGVSFHEAVAAAKGGLESLVLAAAATHARDAIRVNAVRSGLMDSPAASHILRNDNARTLARKQYPLGQLIDPAAVAEALLFLLTAEQITGQILAVDGGFGAVRPLLT